MMSGGEICCTLVHLGILWEGSYVTRNDPGTVPRSYPDLAQILPRSGPDWISNTKVPKPRSGLACTTCQASVRYLIDKPAGLEPRTPHPRVSSRHQASFADRSLCSMNELNIFQLKIMFHRSENLTIGSHRFLKAS